MTRPTSDQLPVVIVMGPSGAGKTTVGEQLAQAMDWPFIEGDDLHPPANVDKMRAGEPLTDADRAPWLATLRRRIDRLLAEATPAVIACSALKRAYRDRLRADPERVRFVFLKAPEPVLQERLEQRRGHYMKPSLLGSQLAALETPADGDALTIDATRPVDELVEQLKAWIT